jgi:hypothetical protein
MANESAMELHCMTDEEWEEYYNKYIKNKVVVATVDDTEPLFFEGVNYE